MSVSTGVTDLSHSSGSFLLQTGKASVSSASVHPLAEEASIAETPVTGENGTTPGN